MALSSDQLAWLRSEVGDRETDQQLNDRFDRLGSVRDVAIEALRERRAELLDSPLSVNVNGVASVNYAENVKALERRLSALTRLDDDPSDDSPLGDGTVSPGGHSEFQQVQLTRSRGR